ncbi:alpha/beta fold hydrolase [Streptomyces sp. NBC_00038]|uniref:alpha/beta fold hydrolase n=1 Tax=Streptomyces sp. NBC_00038 TaxID=2903615 RepID=UPI002250C61D|nr:alpha/beta hydrolase [Streptomyces sp. NBC_00038]MCX5554533.1 alpha/beta hydrolase [Streptomyces sp. NBC_00038]
MTTYTPIGRYFAVKDGRLYGHVREGDGPALVFLHYWGGSHRTWRPVIERLSPAQAFVSCDSRGWGESTEVPGPYGIEQLADDAQCVIEGPGYGEYVVVGHSMGGKVTQVLASRYPAGLKGVVLVAPAPPAPVGVTPEFQKTLSHAYDNAETIDQSIDQVLTNGELWAEVRQQVHEDSSRAGEAARMAWPRGGRPHDARIYVSGALLSRSPDVSAARRGWGWGHLWRPACRREGLGRQGSAPADLARPGPSNRAVDTAPGVTGTLQHGQVSIDPVRPGRWACPR